MLLSLLTRASRATPTEHVRWRGDGVSRIEGLSDTVFGFAITLLVVSLEVPKTSAELLHTMSGFLPFVGSFLVLFRLWRAQFEFFRRYGLEDPVTVRLTGVLLIIVLFSIYPVKFLFTFMLVVLPSNLAQEHNAAIKAVMPLDNLPKILGMYGMGFTGIAVTFALLYRNALRQAEALQLTPLERFDTAATVKRWWRASLVGGSMLVWCGAVLSLGEHLRRRDEVFEWVYFGGCLLVIATALTQRRLRSRLARERLDISDTPGAGAEPATIVDARAPA